MTVPLTVGTRIAAALLTGGILLSSHSRAHAQDPAPKTVEYLSDVAGSGYEWLEQQQRQANGGQCKPVTMDELLAAASTLPRREGWEEPGKLFAKLGFDRVALPTRCENVGGFLILNRIAEEVRIAASREASRDIARIVWGTLPFREVNASAQKVGADYVVALDNALFAFLYSLLLTVDRTVIIERRGGRVGLRNSPDDFRVALARSPDILQDFSNLIVSFANGDSLPNIRFATGLEAPLVIRQLNSIERFIVGHEFGHVLAGHTDKGLRLLSLPMAAGGVLRLPSLGRDWKQELDADEIGQRLGEAARTSDESGLTEGVPLLFEVVSAYAPVLFLQIADTLDDAIFCKGSGEGSVRGVSDNDRVRFVGQISALREQGNNIRVPDDLAAMLGCRQGAHPPAWLRAELASRRVDKKYLNPPRRPTAEVAFATALVANAAMLAKLAAPEIIRRLSR